jgi:hypothetical protein
VVPPSLTLPHKGGGNGESVPSLTVSDELRDAF